MRIFPGVPKRFYRGAKSGKILFSLSETKKTTFFAKNVIQKCKFQIKFLAKKVICLVSGGLNRNLPLPPFRRPCVRTGVETFDTSAGAVTQYAVLVRAIPGGWVRGMKVRRLAVLFNLSAFHR